MKRIFTFGFQTRLTHPALSRLKQDPELQVLRSFPDDSAAVSLSELNLGHMPFEATPLPEPCLRHMDAHFPVFCRLYNRQDTRYQSYRYFTFENAYMSLIQFFYRELTTHSPDAVVFSYCPHSPAPFVMYQLCKYLDIETLILRESNFTGKIYYFNELEDFGTFSKVPALSPPLEFTIPQGHKVKWFVLTEEDAYQVTTFKERLVRKLKHTPSVRTFADAYRFDGFPLTTFSAPISRYFKLKKYIRTMSKMTASSVDLNRKYVYFALNYQPELTTTLFGSDFQDMAYALECLSALIPDDWVIYAKEHPRQSDYQRNPELLKRMAALKNVQFAPTHMSSLELIEKAQFNATVSGSAGWESISGGVPALVFGLPWYLSFPGVTRYTASITVDDILSKTFTHHDIQNHFKTFSKYLADGYLESSRYPTFSRFDPTQVDLDHNAERLTTLIKTVLKATPS
jgi:hypothetical protein